MWFDVEGTGFSQETDLNKEKPWDGVFKLRGGKAVNVEQQGSRKQCLGFEGLPSPLMMRLWTHYISYFSLD